MNLSMPHELTHFLNIWNIACVVNPIHPLRYSPQSKQSDQQQACGRHKSLHKGRRRFRSLRQARSDRPWWRWGQTRCPRRRARPQTRWRGGRSSRCRGWKRSPGGGQRCGTHRGPGAGCWPGSQDGLVRGFVCFVRSLSLIDSVLCYDLMNLRCDGLFYNGRRCLPTGQWWKTLLYRQTRPQSLFLSFKVRLKVAKNRFKREFSLNTSLWSLDTSATFDTLIHWSMKLLGQ